MAAPPFFCSMACPPRSMLGLVQDRRTRIAYFYGEEPILRRAGTYYVPEVDAMYGILIAYRFTRKETEYGNFFDKIEELSAGNWIELFPGCILTGRSLRPQGYRRRLLPLLQKRDRLFICQFGRESCGLLSDSGKEWLRQNVFLEDDVETAVREQLSTQEKK